MILVRLGVVAALVLGAALAAALGPAAADPLAGSDHCTASTSGLGTLLERTRQRIDTASDLTILAIGSSSTSGVGASHPSMAYPSRLERDLARVFPKLTIRVLNDGRGGQDAEQELARLDHDLGALQPDLVIWQVGTNALLRHLDLDAERRLIERGVGLIKERGIDVVLMDLQYAPRVLAQASLAAMERIIADTAKRERVGYLRRFEIMREWSLSGRWAADTLIRADGLHMTDESYGCLAAVLSQSLADAARPAARATERLAHSQRGLAAPPGTPATAP